MESTASPSPGFNSRLREEATVKLRSLGLQTRRFNSRLREEATGFSLQPNEANRVSTHASVRRRRISPPSARVVRRFQLTPP